VIQQWKKAALILCSLLAGGAFAQEQIEPRAGAWKTWILQSGSELRLPAPPNRGATEGEIAWLKSFMASADANARSQVSYWDTGSPGMRWIEIVTDRIRDGRVPITQGWQHAVLLPVATYDATVGSLGLEICSQPPQTKRRGFFSEARYGSSQQPFLSGGACSCGGSRRGSPELFLSGRG